MGVSAAVAGTAISCGESRGRGSWRFFTEREALVVEATCAQLIPTHRDPGAREAGVVHYIDIQLAKRLRKHQAAYRKGIAALDAGSRSKFGKGFVELTADQQVEALNALEENSGAFFDVLLAQTRQGFYGDPRHGGNRDIMRARQATRTAQQGCGAVAVGQLDTEDEPAFGSSQPLFLRCQTLAGTFGLALASDPAEHRGPTSALAVVRLPNPC